MLAFSDGLRVRISKVSRERSSGLELQEERILKSLKETGWPVARWCDKTLVSWGLEYPFPVRGEMPMWLDARVCKWQAVCPM